jgi:hypothetical protein
MSSTSKAERTLTAIDQRIADLCGRRYLSSADLTTLASLDKTRKTASALADKRWARHRQDLERKIESATVTDRSPAGDVPR